MPSPSLLLPSRLFVAVAALAALAAAQTTISYSRLDWGNGYRLDREDYFPNSRRDLGSEDGDFLYKAFPAEVMARDGVIRISGLRVAFSPDKSYTGNFPAFVVLPEVAFFPLVRRAIGGVTYDLPDLTRRHARTLPLPGTQVVRAGITTFELQVGPQQPDPRLRTPVDLPSRDAQGNLQGWAVALLAPPSEKQADGFAHFVAVPTFNEIHRLPGPPTFSGAYDAVGNRFLPYGTAGAPSNVGELAVELLHDQPTLQVYSDASGGVRNDPRRIETHKGPGAYLGDLASSVVPGYFGLFCQWQGHENEGVYALPLVTAIGPAMPTDTITVGGVRLIYDPMRTQGLLAFLDTGNFGALVRYKAGGDAGHAEDQNGVFVTQRIPVPVTPALRGLTLWIQAVFGRSYQFLGASNLVRLVV
jgi:hypothetical protein